MLHHIGAEGMIPLETLKDELHYNPTAAVQSIARLRVIGDALGPEGTRTELLPYLTSEIVQGNLTEEVLFAIADVLGSFVEFVSSCEDARSLIAPLRELCCVEELAVRERAVHAVNSIGSQLPAELVAHIVPMVLELGKEDDWYTPRVAACGMLPLAVGLSLRLSTSAGSAGARSAISSPRARPFEPSGGDAVTPEPPATLVTSGRSHSFSSLDAIQGAGSAGAGSSGGAGSGSGAGDASVAELLAVFSSLSSDESVEVRRAAAECMQPLATALDTAPSTRALVAAELSPAYARLLTDEAEAVRVAALSASAAVASAVSLGDGHPAAAKLVGASRDKAAAVRVAVADALPGVARADTGAPPSPRAPADACPDARAEAPSALSRSLSPAPTSSLLLWPSLTSSRLLSPSFRRGGPRARDRREPRRRRRARRARGGRAAGRRAHRRRGRPLRRLGASDAPDCFRLLLVASDCF